MKSSGEPIAIAIGSYRNEWSKRFNAFNGIFNNVSNIHMIWPPNIVGKSIRFLVPVVGMWNAVEKWQTIIIEVLHDE